MLAVVLRRSGREWKHDGMQRALVNTLLVIAPHLAHREERPGPRTLSEQEHEKEDQHSEQANWSPGGGLPRSLDSHSWLVTDQVS